eukprot:TRINITY_DN3624_c0_g2_i1.p1 TRINITY_DN3624_c0_g2~~TRINITY_DN3624_c0_g2_i1.p1  ORF type:complete len:491 (+),score=89.83 TRINITY_DN3624_c0_g2_i1:75-1547(+)
MCGPVTGGYTAGTDGRQKVVVIVDPYSSGRYLVQELQAQRWAMVGVQSTQQLADFWLQQYDPSMFLKTIRHETLDETVAQLSDFDVAAVLAGSEPGVLLTEDLADHFRLPGNAAATKEWRRDKYPQQERLREVGVRAIHQIHTADIDECLKWQEKWGQWPIIVKPTMSGGTDGVYWCHNAEDVRTAFSAECGRMNVNGVVNAKLLAQEYLIGPEYIVDCVSHEGRHVVSGIWVYKKTKDPATRSISYEYARLLESTGQEQDILTEYVFKCLDALEIRYGPSHSEVILTADGPCLVETGARMHGCKGPKLLEYATGTGTHELVLDVALYGARLFNDLYKKGTKYSVKKWAFETFMRNGTLENKGVQGILRKSLDVPELRNLVSVVDVLPSVQVGQELQPTRDLATSPGLVLQVHPDLEACLRDIEALRSLEATRLYVVNKPERERSPSPPRRQVSPMCSPVRPHRSSSKIVSDEEDGEFTLTGRDAALLDG